MAAPTVAQIRAQVARVREKFPDAPAIGLRLTAPAELDGSLRVGEEELPVAMCRSVLEARERLAAEGTPDRPLVLLTPRLHAQDLGADLLARLAHRELYTIEPWALVRDRFKARYVDPNVANDRDFDWVPNTLLEAAAGRELPPAPSGFLAAETIWSVLFEWLLGLPEGRRDPEALLRWGLAPEARTRLARLPEEQRSGLKRAVRDTTGPASATIFDCLAGLYAEHALSIGLVARVLFGPGSDSDADSIRAAGRLEGYCGGEPLSPETAVAWADAAEAVVEAEITQRGLASARPMLDAADRFLEEALRAPGRAEASRFLPQGFERRLEALGSALEKAAGGTGDLRAAAEAAERVREHVLARDESVDRTVEMALRLAAWLERSGEASPPRSFSEAARRYRQEGSFVDRARGFVETGAQGLSALRGALAALCEAVDRPREARSRRFAELLADWAATGSHDRSILGVEEVLDRVVAPLARQAPVLLVVMDGMGVPVYRELQEDVVRRGWVELEPSSGEGRPPVIAALPSVTQASRASLLSGELTRGVARNEAKAFAGHAGLSSASKAGKPPRLAHKDELSGGAGFVLSDDLSRDLRDAERRVVGVVVNAVDDHLAKGEQLRFDWTVERIAPLRSLLDAAAEAARVVVLVSDHGHVLEWGTEAGSGEGERWRSAEGGPEEGEVKLSGPRVLLGEGAIVAPWSDALRYGAKKHGYHGGASPQEVVIPLGVFVPQGLTVEGWAEAPPEAPDWWVEPVRREAPPAEPPPRPAPRPRPRREKAQADLFEERAPEPRAEGAGTTEWIERLLASEAIAARQRSAGRTRLPEARIRAILQALDARGGKATRAALAKELGLPVFRTSHMVSALRRLLNVDGFSILDVDEASDTVELNRQRLERQFGL